MDVVAELFDSLESNNLQVAEEAKKRFHEHFNSTKDTWLVNGLFDYYISTSSVRCIDILVGVREPHDRYIFDRMAESLKGSQKLQALTLLGHVVRRHPSWLYKIIYHPLIKDLLRLLKAEKDVLPLMSALLIVIILLPIIAGLLTSHHLQDLFDIFSHLAAWNTNNPNKVPEGLLLHLQIGLYALFNRLYGMYPCNFLSYLRQHYSATENLSIFSHTIKPMLDTVKMHPLLVTASKDTEVAPARWKKMEANDVIMECAKYSIETSSDRSREDCFFRTRTASFRSRPCLEFSQSMFEKNRGKELGNKVVPVVGSYSSNLPDEGEHWSPTIFTAIAPPESAPTPITHTTAQTYVISTYSSQEGNSPPEAAIEATPESTPVKDLRQTEVRRPSSTVARSLNNSQAFSAQSQPSSPMKKEQSPFRFPPTSTPTPTAQEASGSAFQSSATRSKELKKVTRLAMLERDRLAFQQENAPGSLKPKTPVGGNLNYQPSSPLRVISTPSPFDRSTVNSPYLQSSERTEEDREVESTMRPADHNNTYNLTQLKRGDSVIQDISTEEQEEYEECVEAGEVGGCVDGGLHMPDSRSMIQFARQVNRLRFHSQCQPDTFQLAQIGLSGGSSPRESTLYTDNKVRRANSCPEMKKDTHLGGIGLMDLSATTFEETEEENEERALKQEKAGGKIKELVSTFTQTEESQPLVYEYEHLFLSVFPPLDQIQQHSAPPDITSQPSFRDPQTALELFMETTVRNLNDKKKVIDNNDMKNLKQQLELLMYQLQFERHRREVHAERNRRLLGKSRPNRALEEHNSALRDQVTLMEKEIETLHNELERSKREAKHNCGQLQENLNYWQEQTSTLQRKYKEAQGQISLLEKELEEEKRKILQLSKEYTLSQAQLFELKNTLEGATAAATAGREVKGELALLQHHLAAAGELETRLRSSISSLTLRCHQAAEAIIATHTYSHRLSGLQSTLKMRDNCLDASKIKVNEAQQIIEKKEALYLEKDKLVENVISKYSQELKNSEDTCKRLRELHSHQEEQILELTQQIEVLEQKLKKMSVTKTPNQVQDAALQSSPPLSTSLSSGTLSLTGGSPQIQNLQLLVDIHEPGPSSKDTTFL